VPVRRARVDRMRRSRNNSGLGAVTDDPVAIVNRAQREAALAVRERDRLGLRQAAEKGWLAASGAGDVAAAGLGKKAPGGANGRLDALEDLERVARLRPGTLTATFVSAQAFLHGQCFHADECRSESAVFGMLDDVKEMSRATKAALKTPRVQRAARARR